MYYRVNLRFTIAVSIRSVLQHLCRQAGGTYIGQIMAKNYRIGQGHSYA